jgi:hypothetical protein
MLITSKTTNRFIVPKGWPMKGISGRKTAVAEAWEEAGVVGEALKEPLGVCAYWKRLSGHFVRVTVKVYLLSVVDVQPDWNERSQRQRAWLSPADAAALIDEPQLASLVRSMAQAPVSLNQRSATSIGKVRRIPHLAKPAAIYANVERWRRARAHFPTILASSCVCRVSPRWPRAAATDAVAVATPLLGKGPHGEWSTNGSGLAQVPDDFRVGLTQ